MPCLKILTNLPQSSIPKEFVNNIIPVLSRAIRKPVNVFTCVVSSDCHVSFGGESTSPGAVATLESIGHLGPQENKIIAKEISDFVEKGLGISQSRFFLTFYDMTVYDVAIRGDTVG